MKFRQGLVLHNVTINLDIFFTFMEDKIGNNMQGGLIVTINMSENLEWNFVINLEVDK